MVARCVVCAAVLPSKAFPPAALTPACHPAHAAACWLCWLRPPAPATAATAPATTTAAARPLTIADIAAAARHAYPPVDDDPTATPAASVRCPACGHSPADLALFCRSVCAAELRALGAGPSLLWRLGATAPRAAAVAGQLSVEAARLDGSTVVCRIAHRQTWAALTLADVHAAIAASAGVPPMELAVILPRAPAPGVRRLESTSLTAVGARPASDAGIEPGTRLHILHILCRLPTVRKVQFDLGWGFPAGGSSDYLDGSCLLFDAGGTFVQAIDYSKQGYPAGSPTPPVAHSGDVMDPAGRRGRHCISVDLARLPTNITTLFFALSAYVAPTIASFVTPSLRMFDPTTPNQADLCAYAITERAGRLQAVIMAALVRGGPGDTAATVIVVDQASAGTVRDYSVMAATAASTLAQLRGAT